MIPGRITKPPRAVTVPPPICPWKLVISTRLLLRVSTPLPFCRPDGAPAIDRFAFTI